ncbi:D-glycero-beta-D-manno-heptose 1-phosphate adenylyltransferase, partial [Streptomyces sp. SID1328]|nr:D-glycero-beta-D-manno-heptose 1-phosphate adenylyltransferase [Streptomyces sp. SID1328]
VRLATPSATEAHTFAARSGGPVGDPDDELRLAAQDAHQLVGDWRAASVAVTMSGRGALLSHGGTPLMV